MTPIFNPMIFYWIEFISKLGLFITIVSIIGIGISGFLAYLIYFNSEPNEYSENDDEELQKLKLEKPQLYSKSLTTYNSKGDNYLKKDDDYEAKALVWRDTYEKTKIKNKLAYDTEHKKFVKAPLIALVSFIMLWCSTIAIPSESTMYKMIIANNITENNIESVKGEVNDLIDYIIDKIDELND